VLLLLLLCCFLHKIALQILVSNFLAFAKGPLGFGSSQNRKSRKIGIRRETQKNFQAKKVDEGSGAPELQQQQQSQQQEATKP